MRILHCNWVDPDDPAGRGGGVRLYLRGLIDAQRCENGYECTALSAGMAYDLAARAAPFWRSIGPGRYELVNTRPVAPSHADFASIAQIQHPQTEAVFQDFIRETGPYDVVHFHSLEGFPANILKLREDLPQTQFVLTLHNYYPFCPQVNLWWQERAHCEDFENGARCGTCLPLRPNPMSVRRVYAVETAFARSGMPPGRRLFEAVLRPGLALGWRILKAFRSRGRKEPLEDHVAVDAAQTAAFFAHRRAEMVRLINAHCDTVLAVSDRVRAIAGRFGVNDARVCYIGTRHAEAWARTAPRALQTAPLRLAYLGYMRADKGFPFLIDALESLPPQTLSRMQLTVAAKKGPQDLMARMDALSQRLAGLDWRDGYGQDKLDRILENVDIGIVPPLWEDNLPQVALEMHARHIPILTSDRGGAQELAGTSDLVFRAGDQEDFARVVDSVLEGRVDLSAYWRHAKPPVNMAQHALALDAIYRGV